MNNLTRILSENRKVLISCSIGHPAFEEILGYIKDKTGIDAYEHKDCIILKANGNTSIGTSSLEPLFEKLRYAPSILDATYLLIDGFDAITSQAQNKLLKTLEDAENVIVYAATYDVTKVLDTVKSRLTPYTYKGLSEEAFYEACSKMSLDRIDLWYAFTKGCPGLISRVIDAGLNLTSLSKAYTNGDTKKLLTELFLVKEKDECHEKIMPFYRHILSLFCFITCQSNDYSRSMKRLEILNTHYRYSLSDTYTKDDFFQCIVSL